MNNQVNVMTFSQLKKIVEELSENNEIMDTTKIFIDTGWDSVQEVDPKAISIEKVKQFKVQDELTKDVFSGYSLLEKAERMEAEGEPEAAIIIRNLY
ncbi:hypothetical protein [Enterococcus rivorum]|uniref:Uncharacterized protein n=1 Tax=Enterococcus rivorum TaxID=762845 RepID=A0A1E5KVF1_9ENTE|nr:hypothetical protein [Enterococcus rivorum]MBP2100201.1 hypothetical protein [Enterococcus rivorum]OEH81788.1 hypothetical protein BCR26_03245 [Enterococcus rivorum]